MKQGFSVLELVMSMSIATMLMTSLLMVYNQITKNMIRVDRFVREDTQILTLKNRFARDIEGISGIWYTQEELEKNIDAGKEKKEQEPDKKKRAPYFYSVNKNGHFHMLTFVTNNPLKSYGASQDRLTRVVYQLQPDTENKTLVSLVRKELKNPTEVIDEKALQQGTWYELASGIASIDVTYYLLDQVQLQKQYQQQAQEKSADKPVEEKNESKKPIFKAVTQWNIAAMGNDDKKDTQEQHEKKDDVSGAAAPKFVEMKIVFGATEQYPEKTYLLSFSIPCSLDDIPKSIMSEKK